MHKLLYIEISREPGEVVPVAKLVFELSLLGFSWAYPHASVETTTFHTHHIANQAIMDFGDQFLGILFISPAKSGNQGQVLLFGLFGRS